LRRFNIMIMALIRYGDFICPTLRETQTNINFNNKHSLHAYIGYDKMTMGHENYINNIDGLV
jgi:hypothetical protein